MTEATTIEYARQFDAWKVRGLCRVCVPFAYVPIGSKPPLSLQICICYDDEEPDTETKSVSAGEKEYLRQLRVWEEKVECKICTPFKSYEIGSKPTFYKWKCACPNIISYSSIAAKIVPPPPVVLAPRAIAPKKKVTQHRHQLNGVVMTCLVPPPVKYVSDSHIQNRMRLSREIRTLVQRRKRRVAQLPRGVRAQIAPTNESMNGVLSFLSDLIVRPTGTYGSVDTKVVGDICRVLKASTDTERDLTAVNMLLDFKGVRPIVGAVPQSGKGSFIGDLIKKHVSDPLIDATTSNPIQVGLSAETSTLVSDVVNKLSDIMTAFNDTPLASGVHKISLEIPAELKQFFKTIVVPTGGIVFGAALTYYAYKYPSNPFIAGLLSVAGIAIGIWSGHSLLGDTYRAVCTALHNYLSVTEATEELPTNDTDSVIYDDEPVYGEDGLYAGKISGAVKQSLEAALRSIAAPLITWFVHGFGEKPSDSLVKKFCSFSKVAKELNEGVNFGVETIVTFVSEIISWLSHVFGWKSLDGVFEMHPNLKMMEDRVAAIVADVRTGSFRATKLLAGEVETLRANLVKIMIPIKTGSALWTRCTFLQKSIDHLYTCTRTAYASNQIRPVPVGLALLGPPGLGKSLVCQNLARLINTMGLTGKDKERNDADPGSNIYTVLADANFDDGYTNQKCVIIDDILVEHALTSGSLDEGTKSVIRWGNGMPYMVESAHVDRKGMDYAENEVLILTANKKAFNVVTMPTLTDPRAFIRRVPLSFLLTSKADFAKNPDSTWWDRQADFSLLDGKFSPDIWLFVPWDWSTGKRDLSREPVDYLGLAALAANEMIKNRRFHAAYKAGTEDTLQYVQSLKVGDDGLYAIPAMKRTVHMYDDKGTKTEVPLATIKAMKNAKPEMFRHNGPGALDPLWLTPRGRDAKTYIDRNHWVTEAYMQSVKESHSIEEFTNEGLLAYTEQLMNVDPTRVYDIPGLGILRHYAEGIRARSIEGFMAIYQSRLFQQVAQPIENIWADVAAFVTPFAPVVVSILSALAFVGTLSVAIKMAFPVKSKIVKKAGGQSLMPKQRHRPASSKKLSARVKNAKLVNAAPQLSKNAVDIVECVDRNRVEVFLSDMEGRAGTGLGICGNTLIMPAHFIGALAQSSEEDPDVTITIKRKTAGSGGSVTMKFEDLAGRIFFPYETVDDVDEDIVIITLPEGSLRKFKNIVKFFPSRDDPIFRETKVKGFFHKSSWVAGVSKDSYHHDITMWNSSVNPYEIYQASKALSYAIPTGSGDCGSLAFVETNATHIVGMHVCGVPSTMFRPALGASIVLYKELFDKFTDVPDPVTFEALDDAKMEIFTPTAGMISSLPIGTIVGSCRRPFSSGKSDDVESVLHNIIKPSNLTNSVLKRVVIDDVWVDPKLRALSNYCLPSVYCNEVLADDIFDSLFEYSVRHTGIGTRVLDVDEAIYGGPTIQPMNAGTSPGIPYVFNKRSWPGKTYWVGKEGARDGPGYNELRSDVDSVLESVVRGDSVQPKCLFQMVLKDELLKKAKVAKADTRCIFASCIVLQVIIRMYFGDIMAKMQSAESRIHNRQATGVNPFAEWGAVASFLTQFGTKRLMAMDFKKFDGSISRQLLIKVLRMLCRMYPAASAEDSLVREWIIEQLCAAWVVVDGTVIEFSGNNVSGNVLTVIINNFMNQFYNIYACVRYLMETRGIASYTTGCVDFEEINTDFRMISLGDDFVSGYGHIFDGLDAAFMYKTLKEIGVTITKADKTDASSCHLGFESLSDIGFLKRGFNKVAGCMVAPLELDSILKMIHWQKKGMSVSEFEAKCKDALFEFSLHGKEKYNEWSSVLVREYILRTECPLIAPRWEDAFKRSLERDYACA